MMWVYSCSRRSVRTHTYGVRREPHGDHLDRVKVAVSTTKIDRDVIAV